MEYSEFIEIGYKPNKNDLICLFRVEPAKGFRIREVAERVASESSVGTWTKLLATETAEVKKRIKNLAAKVFAIKGNYVKIAYPSDLFELGNMPQIVSSIAGNIFGMKALNNLRLEDVHWPKKIIKSFHGPQFGIKGIRKIFKVWKRPLTATVPKPKVGMTTKEHAKVGYEAWIGGIDMLKDDENLSSQKFNKFEQRVKESLKMRDRAERKTGEKKSYLINITAETKEMLRRAKFVKNNGGEYVMVDILTAGWAGLQSVRSECKDLKLAIHGHRAFHSSFTRNPKHGISMLVVADMSRLVGVDQLHIGTVVGKLVSPQEEVLLLENEIKNRFVKAGKHSLAENWYNIKPVFPVASGGLHAGIIPEVMKILGNDIIIQVGGGVHAIGTRIGSASVRQAVEANLKKIPLEKYAKKHSELKIALNTFGHRKPK